MDQIVILDFGSQTTHLIGRRIREGQVYTRIVPGDSPAAEWLSEDVRGIILSGSPASVHDSDAPRPDPAVYESGLPILGICYGLQVTIDRLGGSVSRSQEREYGLAIVNAEERNPIVSPAGPTQFRSWMSHGDTIQTLPDRATVVGKSQNGLPAVVNIPDLAFTGLQFHPEVTHTDGGSALLVRFATERCGAAQEWTMDTYLTEIQDEVRRKVGSTPVLLLISGGVDSTVVAALLLQTLVPDQVHLMYIDTGLMRSGETEQVTTALTQLGARHLHIIDAQNEFLTALSGVLDPEEKRSIIGDLFVRVQEREIARHIPGDYYLAQGTLYTDLVESGHGVGRHGARIKSHHNVATPLIAEKRKAGKIIEPLSSLYKDEVRRLGTLLGLPGSVVDRHPFPGPGLAVRILGEVTRERCDTLRSADSIYIQELRDRGLYDEIWQAFSVLLPIQSVGVAGDARVYGDVLALRAVVSRDGMTADAYPFLMDTIMEIANRITNQVPQVGRVVYDLSSKPPATIEWE